MVRRTRPTPPPHVYFVVSAIFHYLGPSFAVLLFARVPVLGVAWLRIASAAIVFALWRRPWRALRRADRDARATLVAWGAILAVMNVCFYEAIDRLPLGTVAAIEFLPVIVLAAVGARTARNAAALALAVPGVYLLTDVRLAGEPLGVAFALANAVLFAAYIVLAHRVARRRDVGGLDGLAAAMLVAAVVVCPFGGWEAAPAFLDPVVLLAGIGVGISSSVIPYVSDQLAMRRLPRATYALMVSLLPATATIVGIVVLAQVPSWVEVTGVGLVVAGVAVHRDPEPREDQRALRSDERARQGLPEYSIEVCPARYDDRDGSSAADRARRSAPGRGAAAHLQDAPLQDGPANRHDADLRALLLGEGQAHHRSG
jgi:inner membrane transporter RhtA